MSGWSSRFLQAFELIIILISIDHIDVILETCVNKVAQPGSEQYEFKETKMLILSAAIKRAAELNLAPETFDVILCAWVFL